MALTPINLFEGVILAGSITTYYTSPSQTRTIINKFTINNFSGGPIGITVWLVPKGGSTGNSNVIINSLSIPTLVTVDLYQTMNHILEAGDTIQAVASANTLSARASGIQIT